MNDVSNISNVSNITNVSKEHILDTVTEPCILKIPSSIVGYFGDLILSIAKYRVLTVDHLQEGC